MPLTNRSCTQDSQAPAESETEYLQRLRSPAIQLLYAELQIAIPFIEQRIKQRITELHADGLPLPTVYTLLFEELNSLYSK